MVSVLGIPLDSNSSFLPGAASAPQKIREAYHSASANYCAENGTDLSQMQSWKDQGDLPLPGMPEAFAAIEQNVSNLLGKDHRVLSLGGDHSIIYPIIKAFAKKYRNLNILHLDAHGDLYDNFEGNKFSHACPFARIMEEGLASRLVQVGIRTYNPHQREQARRFGVESIEMKDWKDGTVLVGATVEDVGFDESTTAAGLRGLLNAAVDVMPALEQEGKVKRRGSGWHPA